MTEYDYSPEAYERYMRNQSRVGNWVSETTRASDQYGNPFVLSPAHAARALDAWRDKTPTPPPTQPIYVPPRSHAHHPTHIQTQPGPSRHTSLSSKPRSPTTRSPTTSKPEKPRGRDRSLGSSTTTSAAVATAAGPHHPPLNPKRSKTLPPNVDPRPPQNRSRSHSHSQQREPFQPGHVHYQPQPLPQAQPLPQPLAHVQVQAPYHPTHVHTQSQPQPVQHQSLRRTQSRTRSQSQGQQAWQLVEKPSTRSRDNSKTRSPLSRSSSHRRTPSSQQHYHQQGTVSPSVTLKTSPRSHDRSPPTTPAVSIPASPPRGAPPVRGGSTPVPALGHPQSSYDGNSSTIYLPPGPPGQTYFVVPPPGGRVVAGDPADKVYPSRAPPTSPTKQSFLKRLIGFIISSSGSSTSHKSSEKSGRGKSRRSNRRSSY